MTEGIRAWLLSAVAVSLLSAAVLSLAPEGRGKRVLRLACGLAAAMALLSGVAEPDYGLLAESLREAQRRAAEAVAEGEGRASRETRYGIETAAAAYILDKAAAAGITGITVSVTASWSDRGFWVPAGAAVCGAVSPQERARLTEMLASDLGLDPGAVRWEAESEQDKG